MSCGLILEDSGIYMNAFLNPILHGLFQADSAHYCNQTCYTNYLGQYQLIS